MSRLYGVFAVHSPESCPLNNARSKEIFLGIDSKIKESIAKSNINKIVGFYMSVLEHEWILIIEAESAHEIENMCIEVGISEISTVKIVPLNDFSVALNKIKNL